MKNLFYFLCLSVISLNCQKEISNENIIAIPTLTTTVVTSITSTTAAGGGNISSDGGATITARGVCWSTTPNPVITGNHTTNGTGTGTFTSAITGLTASTVYFVRAYATNSEGTAYGNEISFTTTTSTTALPTLTTTPITAITFTSASGGGNITADGGDAITARGVCWSTSANPIVTGNHTIDGSGMGTFTSAITGLAASTIYYVRAYATNSVGTAYGNQLSFTTSAIAGLPTITTNAISAITSSTATSGGNISTDGGAAVTARGVCWSTTTNPIVTGNHTINGTGTGTFTSSITGLTSSTTYYVRAYATNSAGTAYGNQLSFTSAAGPATGDVYIGGFEKSGGGIKKAAVWKNGVVTYQPDVIFGSGFTDAEVNAVFISGTDVYAAGWETSPVNGHKLAMLWKNAVPTILSNQAYDGEARGIYVSGSDVYVTGWENDFTNIQGKLWKNGVASTLFGGNTGARATSVAVSGADVYIGGYANDGTFSFIIPKIVKNGTDMTVSYPQSAGVESIFIDGTDVHAAGWDVDAVGNNKLSYWKNGVRTVIGNTVAYDFNASIHVSGGNVFIAGNSYSGTRSIATYWKNGVITQLNTGPDNYYAKGIFSFGTDVYVVGLKESSPFTVAKLWKNGVESSITNGSTDAAANCVFIK